MTEKVVCFGFKDFEQIPKLYGEPLLKDGSKIKCVTFSWSACYILLENGDLYVSGYVDGNCTKLTKIIQPPESVIVKISCLGTYEVCITENGKCWKRKDNLWQDITNCLNSPIKSCTSKQCSKIIDIVSSDTQYVFLSNIGIAFNFPSQLEIDPIYKVDKIACGIEHGLCLTKNGTIFSWGCGRRGQLGNDELKLSEKPEIVKALDGLLVIDISAGGWHSAAVTEAGDVYTWGWNCFGQLGTGKKITNNKDEPSETLVAIPYCVKWPTGIDPLAKSVSCGTRHTMALFENGSLWGCGWNKYGQIDPILKSKIVYEMTAVTLPTDVIQIKSIHCAAWNTAVIYTTS